MEAVEALEAIEVASVPHYTPEGRESVIARLRRSLSRGETPARAPSMHEALLATGRVDVRETPKKVENGG